MLFEDIGVCDGCCCGDGEGGCGDGEDGCGDGEGGCGDGEGGCGGGVASKELIVFRASSATANALL